MVSMVIIMMIFQSQVVVVLEDLVEVEVVEAVSILIIVHLLEEMALLVEVEVEKVIRVGPFVLEIMEEMEPGL
jgi:hypothetical protein